MSDPKRDPAQRYRGRVGAMLKQDDALALWISGHTYDEVATELGYANKSSAYKAVTAALTRRNEESEERAKQGRAIALERLRPLWRKALDNALSPEGGAKDLMAAAHLADRLQRLEGIKDPAHEVRLTVETELDREIGALMDALGRAGVDPAAVLRDPAR